MIEFSLVKGSSSSGMRVKIGTPFKEAPDHAACSKLTSPPWSKDK